MNATQPPSITIRQIEFELEKAEHGMALPYDARHTRPPDCEATLDGRVSGVEVTELIDQQSLKRNLRDLESPEYFNWAALQKRIDAKDREWKGERYERRVLVIENELNRDIVSRFLEVARFRATRITDAFLGLSYHSSAEPEGGCYPVFHLDLHHAGQT